RQASFMHARPRTAVPSSPAAAAASAGRARAIAVLRALPHTGWLLVAVAAHALPLQITTTSLASGIAGTAYTDTVRTVAGTPPLAFTILSGTLPAGLALDGASGALAGTPMVAGRSAFIVGATDALGDTATAALGITVA